MIIQCAKSSIEFNEGGDLFDQVHVLFHRACTQYPEQTAIEHGEQHLTYKGLLNRVNSIRALLLAHHLDQGKIVAVYGERSVDVIACSIAIWAIGSTPMLIESSMPEHRRNLMLKSVPTSAVVLCDVDCVVDDVPTIDLRLAQESLADFKFENHPRDHAYIAFTSGSTGKPKAIVGSHNGLSQFLAWQSKEFSIGPGERFAHFTNLSFDVWFRDVFTPLISGATVCIPLSPHQSAQSVFDFFRSGHITATHLVPSIASLWINTHWPESPVDDLMYAFFAGEPLEGMLVKKWKRVFPNCQIVNLYGPSETTLAKHFKRIESEVTEGIQLVGFNIPGSMTYILSEDGRLCEPEETGEICIATPYRSHGYWTQEGLASPFVDDLIPGLTTLPMYRTGDLGRRKQNNEIEILGRKDDQIKINGVRIDLLEVKSVIATNPAVRDVFVCARQNRFTKSIVAFIESDNRSDAMLLSFLRSKLPAVMIPSQLHFRTPLPRLPNGKIDRKSLIEYANRPELKPQATPNAQGQSTAAHIEKIWIEILESPDLSRTQNFFDVGGNSLSIVVLHEKVEKQFSLKIPLVRFFQNTTVQLQAQMIDGLLHSAMEGQTSSINVPATQTLSRRRIMKSRTQMKN